MELYFQTDFLPSLKEPMTQNDEKIYILVRGFGNKLFIRFTASVLPERVLVCVCGF